MSQRGTRDRLTERSAHTWDRRARFGVGAAAIALLLAGCSSTPEATPESTPSAEAAAPEESAAPVEQRTLTVLAAASLRDVFAELAEQFESENDGVTVSLAFAGSSDLADQILAGNPADVFASADQNNMDRVTETGDALDPVDFATNTLTVVTPAGNPADVTAFADLAGADVRVVVCASEVPCGRAADAVEEAAGVTMNRVSEEASVTDVLAKVTTGEADAGLVYVTDATLAGDQVDVIDVPETDVIMNIYPIALVNESEQPELAQQWVDFVVGEQGRAVLAAAGFGAP